MSAWRWVAPSLAVLLLGIAGCADDGRDADPGPDPTAASGDPSGDPTGTGGAEVLAQTSEPRQCRLPDSDAGEQTIEVVYGMPTSAQAAGVRLELLSTGTDGDDAELRLERRTPGCRGSARVVVPPRETLEVLGLTLESSATGPWQATPNRAAATVTVSGLAGPGGAR